MGLEGAPWSDDSQDDDQWPPLGIDAADGIRTLPGGAAALAVVDDGPRAGWVQVGLVEQHATPPGRYPDRPARDVMIRLGLEARRQRSVRRRPLAAVDLAVASA